MDLYVREKINEIADVIRKSFNINIPVTNMEEIVVKIGGRLEIETILPQFADGKIQRENDESFVITIPSFQSETRQRFSIAHELGHLFLHMGYMIDKNIWEKNRNDVYFRKEVGEMEYQAHEFAAAFLMPREEFTGKLREFYLGNGMYDIEGVAKYFNVSVEAAINRGRWLGFLAWG